MKFGKLLQGHAEAASVGRRTMFLDYKKLKKLLYGFSAGGDKAENSTAAASSEAVSAEEAAFVDTLNVSPAPAPVSRVAFAPTVVPAWCRRPATHSLAKPLPLSPTCVPSRLTDLTAPWTVGRAATLQRVLRGKGGGVRDQGERSRGPT